ncbi:MAG: dTMP kinase [Pseudomonadota bacterium]
MDARRFITFEGGEGAGKSTQVGLLRARLAELGHEVVVTREPGGAPFAERIRKALLTPSDSAPSALAEALAFYAARAEHLSATIRPALQRGAVVVCDRFNDSTRAYQGAAGGVAANVLDTLDRIVVGDTGPALTFILDLAPKVGLQRADDRRAADVADMFEGRELAFHERLREAYRALAEAEPDRCRLIAADRAPDAIADDIWALVSAHLDIAK